jgi:hypothetical protein
MAFPWKLRGLFSERLARVETEKDLSAESSRAMTAKVLAPQGRKHIA